MHHGTEIYLSEFSGFALENPHSGEDSLQLDDCLLNK